ncbi:MAG: Rrf2 family transcriptional regulator [Armatimonadota bacterium]|jgi:Rrf2 family protein
MLKPSARAEYAVRAMVELAHYDGSGPVPLRGLMKGEPVSRKYLEQLASALRRAGLVRVARGPNGGYQLARPAERISAKDIVESVNGPTSLLDCLASPSSCQRSMACAARHMWGRVNGAILSVLEETTLADLRQQQLARDGGCPLNYEI